jgi:hypothetical protein
MIAIASASTLAGCAFMFPGLDYDNPFDRATAMEFSDTFKAAGIAHSALLKHIVPQSTPIEEARLVLEKYGATCAATGNEGGEYLCIYKNLWTGTYFILAVVERVWYMTYRVHLAGAAGKLDDVSVEVDQSIVDY